MSIALEQYIGLAMLMFGIGVTGVLIRRNLIMVLMAIELMLNAVNIVFVAVSRTNSATDGQIMVLDRKSVV